MLTIWVSLLWLFITAQPGFLRDDLYDDDSESSDDSVHKFWGIQDVTVSVGKLFHYRIPSDAFRGTVVSYDVHGEKEKSLPKWMVFDKQMSALEGVPTEHDVGDTRINVEAYDSKGHFVSDMFTVEVFPLLEKNTNNKRKCKKGEEIMMISIIIDKKLDHISPFNRVTAIKNFSRHFNIPATTLLLLSQNFNADITGSSLSNVHNEITEHQNFSVLTWQIGCNDRIWAEKFTSVQLVKRYVKDNLLSDVLQLPVLEWRLTSNLNPFRTRRHIQGNETMLDQDSEVDDDANDDEDEDDAADSEDNPDENTPDGSPPVFHDYSSKLIDKVQPNPAEKIPVVNTERVNRIGEKSLHDGISSSMNNNNVEPSGQPNRDEDSTEMSPDEEEENINKSNATFFSVGSTPDLPFSSLTSSDSPISVSPTTSVTDKISVTQKRYPPTINEKLPAFTLVAGKRYTKSISENAFQDEDGNTRNLTLKLIKSEECSPLTSWIELNPTTQELYFLPSLDTISNHEFTVEAIDSDNMTANNSLVVAVQYPQDARKVNFEVSLHMKLAPNQNLSVSLLFQLMDQLAKLYNDSNTDNIIVRNVSCSPFVFTWTNKTLSQEQCDNTTILNLLNVLTDTEWNMNINRRVQEEIGSLIEVEKVTWHGIGLCEKIPSALPPQAPKQNFQPIPRDRIDNITARVGELKVYRIPENAFYDADVSSTRDLKLSLLTIDHMPVPEDNWLQFDETNQELYGLPTSHDVGSVKYQVECDDNINSGEDKKARQVIDVIVEAQVKVVYTAEFNMTLSTSYEEFYRSKLLQRSFVEKLATLFGDRNTDSIVISKYVPGSLIITWHNKTLSADKCEEEKIEQLRRVLLNDEGKLQDNVNKVMAPEFEATKAYITPIGVCEGGLTEIHPTEADVPSQEIHAILFSSNISFYFKEYFFEVVLPVIIIIIMMLFAGIVACVLYRRQRRAKWTLGDEDERRTYRNKGIPVIFQDELEERLEPTNKTPIIMKEEKPPLPPPEYQKTLPAMATTALLSDFDDPSYQQGTVTFSTNGTDRNGRSKPTPIYRKPPPYIPP